MNDTYRFKTANTFTISPNSIHSKIVKEFATLEQNIKGIRKKTNNPSC